MYQLTALYKHPEDPAAFEKHYREVHGPLALRLPGLQRYTLAWSSPGADGAQAPYFLIAVLEMESEEAMTAALSGPVGAEAVADLANFAGAGVEMVFGQVDQLL